MSNPSTPKVYVAVIGVGLIGTEFITQLLNLPSSLKTLFSLISITSSKHTLFSPNDPITDIKSWKSNLIASSASPDLTRLTRDLISLITPTQKLALVDNTSSEEIAAMYPAWLKAGINVITPNKKAFSGQLELYQQIENASEASGTRYLNEATVGAGLPVIRTLEDLVDTGDAIDRIEGVLSGTMSYIFNEFSTGTSGGPSFSSVVSLARDQGFTEPHPADDLNGFDVARKLTILSRLIPSLHSLLPSGYLNVKTESLIPADLENIDNGDAFMERLPDFDHILDKKRKEAAEAGNVLRFVGVIDVKRKEISAKLESYSVMHPFATALKGSDNIIMFKTARYDSRPLVVQGPGAGDKVTAMGVLGDLLKLVHRPKGILQQ